MIKASKKLKEYLKVAGLTNRKFAALIEFDEQTTSQVLNGKEAPSSTFIANVLNKTGMQFEAAFETK